MTKVRRPYSRLYWEAIDDPKFATVWDDDGALACWTRLLVAADMAWPASASLYHGVKKRSLDILAAARLVDLLPAGRYRIHGLDKERNARSEKASDAAQARYRDDDEPLPPEPNGGANGTPKGMRPHPVSTADGVPRVEPPGVPSQAEPSRDKQSRAEHEQSARTGLHHVDTDTAAAGEAITGHTFLSAGAAQMSELDRLCEDHGGLSVRAAMVRVADGRRRSWRQLVWDVVKDLEPFADSGPRMTPAERKAAEHAEAVARLNGGGR